MPITNLPAEAAQAKNKLEAGTWFSRVVFTFSADAIGGAETVYFCNDKAGFTYDGNYYQYIPFSLSPLTRSTDGSLPSREMSVSGEAVDTFLMPYIRGKGVVRGSDVVITKVLNENPTIDMSPISETYKASHYVKADGAITIHMGFVRLREQQVPLYQYNHVRCRVYNQFKGTLCGYAGGLTTCDGTPAQCIARSNYARFNAELGLKPKVIKLA